ncbi:MAG: anthranilate phosphoribosyltransferase [Verrucomicrobia bacterium]|nr:anthranilate phosphoribosyltransferase [Verrucomicrobiota bacterium]
MLDLLTQQVANSVALTDEKVALAVAQLVDPSVADGIKANFLTALACKGETTGEIAAFARELRARSIVPPLDAEIRAGEILDVCGTGGDRLNTFNISTTVALVVASAGVTVAKHGNRAITSQSGSADVLEALGIPVELSPEQAVASLREHHFAFFFAPKFHPAFRHIAPARKLCAGRGQRTIFNFLGPLLNPARPTAQLVGVPRPELCEPIARVLQTLGVRRAMVVSGEVAPIRTFPPFDFEPTNRLQMIRVVDKCGTSRLLPISDAVSLAKQKQAILAEVAPNADPPACLLVALSDLERVGKSDPQKLKRLDELSTLGNNSIAEFYQERGFTTSMLSPEQFPLQLASLADLLGGNSAANAEIIRRLLSAEDRGPKRDAVLLNTAAALFVAGKTKSMLDGWEMAAELIDSGRAQKKLWALATNSR